jgi:hypothetical protein
MRYQINLEETFTAEAAHLLHGIQQRFNGHEGRGMAMVQTDPNQPPPGAPVVPCEAGKPCSTTHFGHDPDVHRDHTPFRQEGNATGTLLIVAIIAVLIGSAIGYFFGKRSGRAPG